MITSSLYLSALERISVEGLHGKSILVTGATGMIGSCLIDTLMQWNTTQSNACKVIAAGRKVSRAKERFDCWWGSPYFSFVEQDVCKPLSGFPNQIDYIIHAGSNADPVNFSLDPVGTLLSNVLGTEQLLRYGIEHGMRRFLYVSSGEIYGQPNEHLDDFAEDYCGYVDHSSPRSCYPAGKRAAEVLCQSHIAQHKADVVIVRPCHIFGPTMTSSDSRAVSEFIRNAVEKKNITLKSAGLVERSHCYVIDAVQALLYVLSRGECGQAYNIADRQYQMTIREFAEKVACAGGCAVVFENPSDIEARGYSKVSRAVLSSAKLEALGWSSLPNQFSAIGETVNILKEARKTRLC